jgi:hypothetical protein
VPIVKSIESAKTLGFAQTARHLCWSGDGVRRNPLWRPRLPPFGCSPFYARGGPRAGVEAYAAKGIARRCEAATRGSQTSKPVSAQTHWNPVLGLSSVQSTALGKPYDA